MTPVEPPDVASAPPSAVVCAACDHANPAGARFCNACGSPVHHNQCPFCEAINDGEAERCYKCGKALRPSTHHVAPPAATSAAAGAQGLIDPAPAARDSATAADEPLASAGGSVSNAEAPEEAPLETPIDNAATPVEIPVEPVVQDNRTPANDTKPALSMVERAATATPPDSPSPALPPAKADEPLHYVGRLTAPADEAELDRADVLAHRRARSTRRLRYAAAALLILPSIVAGTLYGMEHQDKVDALVQYTRVAVVAPLVRAASSVLDSQRNGEPPPEKSVEPAEQAKPTPPGSDATTTPSGAPPASSNEAPQDPAHAAETNGGEASTANTAR